MLGLVRSQPRLRLAPALVESQIFFETPKLADLSGLKVDIRHRRCRVRYRCAGLSGRSNRQQPEFR